MHQSSGSSWYAAPVHVSAIFATFLEYIISECTERNNAVIG